GAGWVGKDDGAGGTQVKIVGIEVGHAPRREIIGEREIGGKLQHAVAERLAAVRDVVRGARFGGLHEDVDVTGIVGGGGKTHARLPDGSQSVIGRGVEDGELRQTGSVVRQNPAAAAVVAGVRAEAQVKDAVDQQEA